MENSFAFKNFLYANWYCLFSPAFVHNWGTVRYVTVRILPSLVMLVFPEVLWCSQLDFTDRCLRTPDRYSLVLLCWVLTVFVWRNRSLLTLRLFVCFSAARRHAIHEIFLFSCPRLLFVGTPFFVHATRSSSSSTPFSVSDACDHAVCSELLSIRARVCWVSVQEFLEYVCWKLCIAMDLVIWTPDLLHLDYVILFVVDLCTYFTDRLTLTMTESR